MPAHITANNVMASAKRLMEVRHCCLKSNKMAEIKVPAWPIPIHHTKLTMAKPHPLGIWRPQIPVPFMNRYPMATFSRFTKPKAISRPNTQLNEVRLVSTTLLIFSVT